VLVPSLLSAVSQYITWAIPLSFVPILAKQMGASDVVESMVTTLYLATVALGSYLAAAVANRFGPRRVVGVCFVLLTIGCSTIALTPGMPALFVGQFFLGLGQGTLYPVLMGMSIRDVAEQERTTAMGLHQAVYAVGMFAGPWLSGMLAEAVGLQPMVGVTGFVCLAMAMLLMQWLPRNHGEGLGKG
jgi:MFS family permease